MKKEEIFMILALCFLSFMVGLANGYGSKTRVENSNITSYRNESQKWFNEYLECREDLSRIKLGD